MQEYELPGISDARDRNLNRFMRFCGVSYRLVGEISFQVMLKYQDDLPRCEPCQDNGPSLSVAD